MEKRRRLECQDGSRANMNKEYPMYDQFSELAKNVRRLRAERGWSVKELAKRCGYTELLINDIEKGVASVDVIGLVVLSNVFHVPAKELIIWKDDVARMREERRQKTADCK